MGYEDGDEDDYDDGYSYEYKEFGLLDFDRETYSFPLEFVDLKSTQEAMKFLARTLMGQKFGFVYTQVCGEYNTLGPAPRFYENIVVFCDEWNIPFVPEFHSYLREVLEENNPPWLSSDWSC